MRPASLRIERPFWLGAGIGQRLVWSRSVDDPDRPAIHNVLEIEMEHWPKGGGDLKIIAAVLEQPVIEKLRTHLGLQARAPPRAPVRGQTLPPPRARSTAGLRKSRACGWSMTPALPLAAGC